MPFEPEIADMSRRAELASAPPTPRLKREVIVESQQNARMSAIVGVSSLSGITVGLTLSLMLGFFYMPMATSHRGPSVDGATIAASSPASERAWLGVNITTIDRQSGDAGVRVLRVHEASPAHRAGFLAGDVIRTVDGTPVRSAEHLVRLVRSVAAGTELTIEFDRGDQRMVSQPVVANAPAQVVSWLD